MSAFLEYDPKTHRYFQNGAEVLSVTQILDRAGLISQFCRDDEAAWRGSEVHKLCAEEDEARQEEGSDIDLRTVDPRLRGYLRAWRLYRQQSGFVPTLIEHRVDDFVNRYGGRLDRIGKLHLSGTAVIDLKTSKTGAVSDYVRYQLVAYGHAFKPGYIFERIAVSLRPDGQYRCKVFPMHEFQADLAKWFQILNSVKGENNPK